MPSSNRRNSHQQTSSRQSQNKKSANKIHLGVPIMLLAVGIIMAGMIVVAFGLHTTSVVVATTTNPGNTEITSDMVTVKNLEKSSLPNNYISGKYLSSVVGSYTDIGVTSGGVVTTSNVASEKSRKSAAIRKGYTRMQLSANNIPTGIQTDDHVNVLIGMSLSDYGKSVMTYQNILVTNVNKGSSGNISSLEIEVTPEQAQKIQFAQSNGTITITLLPNGYEEENLEITDESSASQFSNDSSSSSVVINNGKSNSSNDDEDD